MNIFKFSKVAPAALSPSMAVMVIGFVALAPATALAAGHSSGLVYGGDNKPVITGAGDCVRTSRWTPAIGGCGEGVGAEIAMPAEATREDSMMPRGGALTGGRLPGDDRGRDGSVPGGRPDSLLTLAPDIDSDGDSISDDRDACPGTPRGRDVDANGCEVDVNITISGVLFEFDSADLKASVREILDDAANRINRISASSVDVIGHTDSTGPEAYNQYLSELRADAVKTYLEGRGVSDISARGVGESEPVADNGNREGRMQNRRVEVDINP